MTELRTLITDKGVYVCPYFRGREDKKIGDAAKQSFTEMWENRPDTVNPSQDCSFHCIRHETNLNLLEESKSPSIDDYDFFI